MKSEPLRPILPLGEVGVGVVVNEGIRNSDPLLAIILYDESLNKSFSAECFLNENGDSMEKKKFEWCLFLYLVKNLSCIYFATISWSVRTLRSFAEKKTTLLNLENSDCDCKKYGWNKNLEEKM